MLVGSSPPPALMLLRLLASRPDERLPCATRRWGRLVCGVARQTSAAVWVYGGSSCGRRQQSMWRVALSQGELLLSHLPQPASVSAQEIACQGDVAGAREGVGTWGGVGSHSDAQTRGPGDLIWHASASIFDRFVVVHGGRRSPPGVSKARAGAQGDTEGCSLLRALHVFDTQTRRWVPFEVGRCNEGSRCCSAGRFRHTLTKMKIFEDEDPTTKSQRSGALAGEDQGAVVRRGEAAGYAEEELGRLNASAPGSAPAKSEVLLVLGGLPTQRASDELAPCALTCSWNCTGPRADKGENEDGGVRGRLSISCCQIRVDDESRSWVGEAGGGSGARQPGERRDDRSSDHKGQSDSTVGWIGHTACEDGCGGVLVFGGVPCRWSGLELTRLDARLSVAAGRGLDDRTPAPSSDVLKLRLRAGGLGGVGALILNVDKLAVETTTVGFVRPGPAPRFAHSACLLRWDDGGEERRCLMVQGGCVWGGDLAQSGAASDAHLLDLFLLTWRRIPFASAEGAAPLSHAKHVLVPWAAPGAALPTVSPGPSFRVLSIGGQMGCFSFGAVCNRLVSVFRLDTRAGFQRHLTLEVQ